ncbi:MAG: 2-oxoacid:ferredoxin oxidoreductase subunit beta [Elusimicrobia bacterium]|nr:2-oxoacid:ferredoxin oxidoreductase subunit beta [Elusimicrobiota bacterium]
MSKETVVARHPLDELFRADRFPHILCPGCGIGAAMHCLAQAMTESGIPLDRHVCVSGIGCSSRVPGYLNVDSYHTTHGRSIPFATGLALVRPDLEVTVFAGDGDLFAIGGNHFIHAARRNVDLNVICINNFNYGMTGGQAGPTTPFGAKATTAPFGNWERPFNLPYLASAVGAVFVARWTTLHVRQLKEAVRSVMKKKGFAFIEVLSPCPTGFGRPNGIGDGLEEMELYRERCVVDHKASLPDMDIDLRDKKRPIVLGNFLNLDRPHYQPGKIPQETSHG